jgi:PST family polysaccharide transporter
MTFGKASVWNGIAVLFRMASGLVVTKIFAVILGPGGFALAGQVQNLVTILTTLATGATSQGLTKFTAEYHGEEPSRVRLWRTAGGLALLCCLVLVPLTLAASGLLAHRILGEPDFWFVIALAALSLPFAAANTLLLAIVNGRKDIRRLVLAGILGSLTSLLLSVVLALSFGLPGALAALAVMQGAQFLATLAVLRRQPWLSWRSLLGRIDPVMGRRLGGFVAMAATTAVVTPAIQLLARNWLISSFGLVEAGCWEALNRLSAMQLLFFTATLSAWYLPRLSEARSGAEVRSSVHHVLVRVVPVAAVAALLAWLFRDLVITLLFDPSFARMGPLFAAQMVGDTLKIASWVYAFVMIGRGLTSLYILTELLFGAILLGLTVGSATLFGFEAVSLGHAGTYLLYLVAMAALVYRYCRADEPRSGARTGDAAA